MPDPQGPHESVQLMQEHAAATTRKYPFRIAPNTLMALALFTALAAMGLSIQVKQIRGKMEDPLKELPAEEIAKKAPAVDDKASESEQRATALKQMAEWDKAAHEAFLAEAPKHLADLQGDSLARRTDAALWFRQFPEGCTTLSGLLTSPNVMVRRASANALSLSANAPTEDTLAALLTTLREDPDSMTRECAAYGVGRFAFALAHPDDPSLAPPSVSPKLEKLLAGQEDGESSPESGAAPPPGEDLVASAIEALTAAATSDADGHVREAAVFGLAWVQDMRALPTFEEILAGTDATAKYSAAVGVSRLGLLWKRDGVPYEYREQALRVCREMLGSANDRVRARGAEAAGLLRVPAVTERLITMMDPEQEVSWEARARAAEALGRLYERRAANRNDQVAHIVQRVVLGEALDPEPSVRWKSREALQRMAYNANRWGKLEMLKTAPENEVLAGETAREFLGGGSDEHDH